MNMNRHPQDTVVVGLGKTGWSCARHLMRQGLPFSVMDSRESPPYLTTLQCEMPDVPVYVGGLDPAILMAAQQLIVSPGITINEPAIRQAKERGVAVIGDIELFAQLAQTPVIAITGTNGKSTVTALVAAMIQQANKRVGLGGNIGTPVLDLLQQPTPDFYVLELSSFQLETTRSLKPLVATILNITPDHLDRYATLADYQAAKHRIYAQAQWVISNRHDPATHPRTRAYTTTFGLSEPMENEWGLRWVHGEAWLAYGTENWLPVRHMKLAGKHNWENGLAALALGRVIGLPKEAMLVALQTFGGLPHRCQWVREYQGVDWYNDSKATNVGAALAALRGLGDTITGKIIWLAGGQAKSDDFSELTPMLEQEVKHAILFGEAAMTIARHCPVSVEVHQADTLEVAVRIAKQLAQPGDAVLLAPACASFDQFQHFMQRGEVFTQLVHQL